MNRYLVCGAVALLVAAGERPATAQVVQPETIAPGQTIESILSPAAPALEDGVPYGCYAVETAPGDNVAVILSSKSFTPALRIARGALCSAAALQHESDPGAAGPEVRIEFPAAGGRYLILARAAAPGASGAYALKVEGANAPALASTASTDKETERRLIMEREVARREQQIAAAEAARRRREAEAARVAAAQAAFERQLAEEEAAYADAYEDYPQDSYSEPQTNAMGGVLNAFVEGFGSEMQKQADMQAQFDETNRMIARRQAEERRRQERERHAAEADRARAAADQRMAQAQAAAQRAEAAARAAEAQAQSQAEQARIARNNAQTRNSELPKAIKMCQYPASPATIYDQEGSISGRLATICGRASPTETRRECDLGWCKVWLECSAWEAPCPAKASAQ